MGAGCREKLGDKHPSTLTSINNLAGLLEERGRLDEAEPLYQEALAGRREKLGDKHPDTLLSINNLAALLKAQGRLDEAERLDRGALADRQKKPTSGTATCHHCLYFL